MTKFRPALREALYIAAAATVLSITYTGLTGKGMFGPRTTGKVAAVTPGSSGPAMVNLAEAQDLFESGSALFIDTRHAYDFGLGHIAGALNEPLTEFDARIESIKQLPKNKVLVTYCDAADCNSSIEFASRLSGLGFPRVRIFFGGWEEWKSHRLPVEGPKL